jgi:hypothetical protein
MKRVQLTILTALILLAGCEKEDNIDNTVLLSKSWKMTAERVVSPVTGTPLEVYSADWFDPSGCLENQIWTYRTNGELQVDEAPSCITPDSKNSVLGKWMFTSNGRVIDIEIEWFGKVQFTVIELNQKLLRVQRKHTVGVGSTAGNPASPPVEVVVQYDFQPK